MDNEKLFLLIKLMMALLVSSIKWCSTYTLGFGCCDWLPFHVKGLSRLRLARGSLFVAHSMRIEILASYFSSLPDFVLVSLIMNQPLKCGFTTFLWVYYQYWSALVGRCLIWLESIFVTKGIILLEKYVERFFEWP